MKSWLIRKDPHAGKDWGQEEKGTTEDEMVGWHHWCNGHEFEQAPGDSEQQGGLVCCSPWDHRVAHDWVTEQQHLSVPQHSWLHMSGLSVHLEECGYLLLTGPSAREPEWTMWVWDLVKKNHSVYINPFLSQWQLTMLVLFSPTNIKSLIWKQLSPWESLYTVVMH